MRSSSRSHSVRPLFILFALLACLAVATLSLLKDAAVNAARGWKFTPTQLSGTPVKVIGTITFNFNL